ncbi:MAG: endo-polygalacturonase [Armatimonadota bacterium]
MTAPVQVRVEAEEPIRTVRILPASARVRPRIVGGKLLFTVVQPGQLTVEINGDITRSLHIFANRPERKVPKPGDPNVLYFAPGIHEVGHLPVRDGTTIYLAPGAVVRCGIGKEEIGEKRADDKRYYPPSFDIKGDRINVCGRGIIDGELLPVHSRHLMRLTGTDLRVEGVIFRDAPVWNLPIRASERVKVENVKMFGYRANSDGIDIVSSRDVVVENCFLRTFDDLIVIKSDAEGGPTRNVRVRNCVLWNEFAHALSLGAEMSAPVSDIRFEDCDVIHDLGREWTLRIFQSDSALVRDIRFERIRVEESRRLASVWIGKSFWSRDPERGWVIFRDIATLRGTAEIEVKGFDAEHLVRDVLFERVSRSGKRLDAASIPLGPFAERVVVRP